MRKQCDLNLHQKTIYNIHRSKKTVSINTKYLKKKLFKTLNVTIIFQALNYMYTFNVSIIMLDHAKASYSTVYEISKFKSHSAHSTTHYLITCAILVT